MNGAPSLFPFDDTIPIKAVNNSLVPLKLRFSFGKQRALSAEAGEPEPEPEPRGDWRGPFHGRRVENLSLSRRVYYR